MQTQSFSTIQTSEHPSPLSRFPSSQPSFIYKPSPHKGKHRLLSRYLPISHELHIPLVQSMQYESQKSLQFMQEFEANAPSSHYSFPTINPSPQYGIQMKFSITHPNSSHL